MSAGAGDDLSHDAHLRAALRHAPDHALAPPASLTQNILAAARQAQRPTRTTAAPPPVRVTVPPPRPISMLLRWLASPRSAGALATALVASLGIGLWLDLGNEAVVERPPADVLGAQPPAAPAVAAVPTSPPAAVPPAAVPPAAEAGAKQPAAATPADMQREPAAPARTEPSARAPATTAARTADPAPQAARVGQYARKSESAAAAPPRAAPPAKAAALPAEAAAPPATAAAPAPAPVPVPVQADAAARLEQRAAEAPPRQAADDAAPARGKATPGALAEAAVAGRATGSPGHARALAAPAPSPALTLLRLVRAELAAGHAQWEWQAPDADERGPLDDAAQAWLQRVVQGARGRWVEADGAGAGATVPQARWWRDGVLHATLRFEADGLRWVEAGGRVRFAPLDAATSQRLRAR